MVAGLQLFGRRRRVPNSIVVLVLLVLVIRPLKIPKASLIHSGAQRSFVYTFMLIFPTDLLSQIFKLISN